MITLDQFNTISEDDAYGHLEQCCVSKNWISKMIENRPFVNANELITKAADIWYNQCSTLDFQEAFTGHPKIGDLESLKAKFANTKEWANGEQSGMAEANAQVISELATSNTQYEDKFGYIFIVSASGKSATEMLSIINVRLENTPEDEIRVAMGEQHKITVIRLVKLIKDLTGNADLSSHVTTHALDTAIGEPAAGMQITLKSFINGAWSPVSIGITNVDGRVADVLPPGKKLKGYYMMVFDTEKYYQDHETKSFYPEVAVQFEVVDDSHYHIPLLTNPFGYTTYRGS